MGLDRLALLFRRQWVVLLAWQVASIILCGGATLVTLIGSQFERTIPFLMMAMIYLPIFLCSGWKVPKSISLVGIPRGGSLHDRW
jgi:hypothetical protein